MQYGTKRRKYDEYQSHRIFQYDRTIHETLYVLENQICGLLSRRASVALGVVILISEIT